MDSTLKTLLRFAKGVKKYLFFSMLTIVLYTFLNFLSPQLIRVVLDSVIGTIPFDVPDIVLRLVNGAGGRDFFRENIYVCGILILIIAVLSATFFFLARISNSRFSNTYVKNLRDTLYDHIQKLPFSWHVQNQTGDIIQRCTSDVDMIRNFLANQLLQGARSVAIIVIALALMFSMNVKMSLIALIFIPIVIFYSTFFTMRISRKFRVADVAEGELTVAVQENLTGVRVVRAFGREQFELDKFDKANNKFSDLWINMGYSMGAYWGVGDLVTGLQVLTIIIAGAVMAYQGELTLGEYSVFVTYNQMLSWPVRALGRILSETSRARVSVERLKQILDAEQEPPQPGAATPPMNKDISFEGVNFSYGDNHVLKDLNFTIKSGSVFGILGNTGSGKSTITYLLNRLYDLPPENGRITIGGVDIQDIDRSYLRKNVGVVLQEPFLFSKSIRDNIAITNTEAPIEDIRSAAEIAAIDKSVMEFSKGYDTMVGERGVTLSGGQKQRIAIARTLMLSAPVVVLDDSMSAVDLETDAKIRDGLRSGTGDSTLVIISHRINTLMKADTVMVLENGELTQLGSPRELVTVPGHFRDIYNAQSEAAEDI